VRLVDEWLEIWTRHNDVPGPLHAELRPHTAGSELLALNVVDSLGGKKAGVIFAPIQDRRGHNILSVRYQETYDSSLRRKRLMTLLQLFLIHRYQAVSVHYVSPNEDNEKRSASSTK